MKVIFFTTHLFDFEFRSLHFLLFYSWLFLHGRCTGKNPWTGKNQDLKVNLKIQNPRRKSSTFSSILLIFIENFPIYFVSHFQYTIWRKFRQIGFIQIIKLRTAMDISCLPRAYLTSSRGLTGSLSAASISFS